MKINGFRRFFAEDYKDVPQGSWFGALLKGLNTFVDPVITALRNNINFEDNIACEVKNLPFTSMNEVEIKTAFLNAPTGVSVLWVADNAMLVGVASRSIKPGLVGVTLKLSDEKTHDVRLVIYE